MPRRRSLSATRTVTSTVNFVGRIGASLRISGKNAIKRFDSSENSSTSVASPPPPTSTTTTSSWRARLDRSKSAVCQRSLPSHNFNNNNSCSSFDTTDSILLASANSIEAGIGEDYNCTAGELVEYHPNSHALISAQRSFYSTSGGAASGFKSAPSSCPSTPQMIRRRYLKEGATQLTSLSTLITHHRYLFLFNDLLLISKQKNTNSYKLKQKINLERLWISSNNCSHSFLIGWPLNNFVAHFNCEEEKNEWYEKLSECVRLRFKEKSTTVSVAIRIEGRNQNIKKEIHNGQTASEILLNFIRELHLTPSDPLLYELNFETNSGALQLHGIENIYAILMEHILQSGIQLSETQMVHLDTCPLVHCRLVLKAAASTSRPSTAMSLMSQVLKVLSRSENKRLFGKDLEGSVPPQPILTMIDFLMIHGSEVNGIFRKSAKCATLRLLRNQMDQGQVPDFHSYSAHTTAGLLKEYLRSIPGHILLSGNYNLWMEARNERNPERKIQLCKNLLQLLPQCHTVLLKSVLRLLRKVVSNIEFTLMDADNLAICIAPSFIDNLNDISDSTRRVQLVSYLISHAPELFEGFDDDKSALSSDTSSSHSNQVLCLHQSTDSGLSNDEPGDMRISSSISPDSALSESPMSEIDEHECNGGPRIEEIETIPSPESSKERTPVLSRENSDVYTFPHRHHWRSHLSADANVSRLTRQEAFRQVVSTQSSISSQDMNEDLPGLDEEIRVVRLGPSDSIPNVDQLRVSDIIISHRKKESTDSTKTLIGRTDSNGYSSCKSSDYSGKFSNVGSLEGGTSLGGSPYISSLSSSSSTGSSYNFPALRNPPITKTIPVILQSPKGSQTKRPLLTKSDALGLNNHAPTSTTTTTTSAILTPLHRTHRLPPTNHGSLDRSQPSSKVHSRVPLTREAAIYSQNSLDRKSVPYRPPKKTAAEIVLDQNLEINWSVNKMRTRFQTEDAKPAKIDTVYATLKSLHKPAIGSTTAFSR